MKIYQLDQLKNLVQSCHVNFLFGSGLSVPFLSTLQSIEKLLTAAQGIEDKEIRNIVEASLFAEYFYYCPLNFKDSKNVWLER